MLKEFSWHNQRNKVAARHIKALSGKLGRFERRNRDFKMHTPHCIRVRFGDDIGGHHDVLLHWERRDLVVTMRWQTAQYLHYTRIDQLFAAMIWFCKAGPEAEYMTLNMSDGEAPSSARFAPSVYSAETIALPDQYFFDTRGFEKARRLASTKGVNWADRTDDLIWRGGAVGTGVRNPAKELVDNPAIIQRIRLAHLTKDTEIDARFVHVSSTGRDWDRLVRAGLTGDRIKEASWLGRKFAIDIDGCTNTWSNLFIRMRYGCCVLKVESQFGYRQWYYDQLRPYENFVPVKADMSDLFEQYDWVRSNPEKAEEIGRAGQEMVAKMTFESEAEYAAQSIRDNWRWPV